MNIFKIFNTHDDYNNYMSSNNKKLPNISYCEDNDEVHYNMEPPPITVYYDVQDISQPTPIFYNAGAFIKSYEIDDKVFLENTNIPSLNNDEATITYQFDLVGEHYVRYWFHTLAGSTGPNIVGAAGGAPNFYLCPAIRRIYIPYYYVSISSTAFVNTTTLTSIYIPNSVTSIDYAAFASCTSLTSITIPNSVTSIGSSAFSGCTSLTNITIPNSVTSIGNSAFSGCTSLTTVIINNYAIISFNYSGGSLRYIFGNQVKYYIIGSSVTSIGNYAFDGCSNIISVNISNSVTSIGAYAFNGTGLTSITIPDSVTSIGSSAFSGCTSLTSIVIGNSVTSISTYAFYGCTGLTSITIPSSVTSIGNYAFSGCTSLTTVTVNSNAIMSAMFGPSSNIRNIFGSQIQRFIIGDNVTRIGEFAFYYCTNLIDVTIGNNVTSISNYVFGGCSNLTSITSLATTAPTIQNNTFDGVPSGGTLTVPAGSTGYDTWLEYLNNWTKIEQ